MPSMNPFDAVDDVRDYVESFEWKTRLTFEYVFKKLLGLVAAGFVMWTTHVLGEWAASAVNKYMAKEEERAKKLGKGGKDDESTSTFEARNAMVELGGRILYGVIMLLGIMIVLLILGVEIASVVVVVAMVAAFVGFLLQGTLQDVMSGVLLALFQMYRVGDVIRIGDTDGRVIDFRVINTLLQDVRSKTLITIPNRIIQDAVVVNYSRSRYHFYSLSIRVSNEHKEFQKTIASLKRDLDDHAKYPELYRHKDLPARVSVQSMQEPATLISVDVPMTVDDYQSKRESIRTKVRQKLADEGVKMWPMR